MSYALREGLFSIWHMLNSFANESISLEAKQTPYRCSADAEDPKLLQTGEGRWVDNITEPDKGKDFNQGMSTIEQLMKRDQTKEEKPERSGTKEGPTLKYVEHVLSVERVHWLKKIAIEEELEPVVIDLASETDYSSDTDTASETQVM